MKTQLSSLDIHFLLKELQVLIGGKVDTVYHPAKKELLLLFHVPRAGKFMLRLVAGKALFLTSSKEDQSAPSSFCMFLRKHIGNSKLVNLHQMEAERIVCFEFDTKAGKEKLYVEFFAKGNFVFCDASDTILVAEEYVAFKDRSIKSKLTYAYPHLGANLFLAREKELAALFKGSSRDSLVKSLAVELGLGGAFAEEVCLLASIEKTQKPFELEKKEILSLHRVLVGLLHTPISARIVFDGSPLDVVPFALTSYSSLRFEGYDSFNLAFDHYFTNLTVEKKSPSEKKKDSLLRLLEQQSEHIRELESEVAENTSKAELIYANYPLLDSVLKELNEITKKHSWKEISDKLKNHKLVKEVDGKEKRVIVEV